MIESTAYNRTDAESRDLISSRAEIWKAVDCGKDAEPEIKKHAKLVSGIYFRKPETIEQETRERVAKVGPKARVKYLRQCQIAAKARGADGY
jgi:hypothetical protein